MGKPTVSGTYEHVWSGDPALRKPADGDADGAVAFDHAMEMYRDTGDEAHLAPYLNGAEPMRFKLRHLSGEALCELQDYFKRNEEARGGFRAVRHALVSVKGFDLPIDRVRENGFMMTTDEPVARLMGEFPGLIYELAARAITEGSGRPKS